MRLTPMDFGKGTIYVSVRDCFRYLRGEGVLPVYIKAGAISKEEADKLVAGVTRGLDSWESYVASATADEDPCQKL